MSKRTNEMRASGTYEPPDEGSASMAMHIRALSYARRPEHFRIFPSRTWFPAGLIRMRPAVFRCGAGDRVRAVYTTTCLGRVKFLSKPSIPFRVFSVFPITWGICSSLDRQPQWWFQVRVLIRF